MYAKPWGCTRLACILTQCDASEALGPRASRVPLERIVMHAKPWDLRVVKSLTHNHRWEIIVDPGIVDC